MGIIFTESDLHSFSVPFMVQEYVNHDATLFKVFYRLVDDKKFIDRKYRYLLLANILML